MARNDWRQRKVFPTMTLAGVAVNRDLVQHTLHVDKPTASELHRALANETRILASRPESANSSSSLEVCPDGLTKLRARCFRSTSGGSATDSCSRGTVRVPRRSPTRRQR